jgi:hypothetical protein
MKSELPAHDPLLCGLWNYGGPPLCPACRAELVRRGLIGEADTHHGQPAGRQPGEDQEDQEE